MKPSKKIMLAALVAAVVLGFVRSAEGASSLESSFKKSASMRDLKNIRADHWSIAGGNIIVKGNVHIPFGDFDIYADRAVINTESRDLDVNGNIQIYRREHQTAKVTPSELAELENTAGTVVKITGITTDIFGGQKINVDVSYVNGTIKAQSFSGNLITGYFSFTDAELSFSTIVCRAGSGVRGADGIITIKDAELSSCSYLQSQNAHYSISCGEATLYPHNTGEFGLNNAITDRGDYSIVGTNCTINLYGVPVFWLPVFYKPKDENLGLVQTQWGKTGDWGYHISLSKKFYPTDYPASSVRLLADYYQYRGYGYGADAYIDTENSKTRIFGYGIYDLSPYESTDAYDYGIKIPEQRFDFRISNLTHITPTLDFRGNFEIMSDEFFNRDFFNNYYNADPQPVTFAAVEKQFDHFTASVYVRPRVNDFFNAVEQLPTGRIDIHRQELLDTNLYYQGEFSAGYLQRKWREFDYDERNIDMFDYHTGRFDNLNFLYYPIRLGWLNIIPRAGVRFTAYSNSSERKIDDNMLYGMLAADDPGYSDLRGWFVNYDNDGGARFRVAGEFGLEMTTKIYKTWQDVRSPFFQLDGLRHLIEPYVNYTYIPEPSVSREHLYYFDDIDRIQEENFVRLGVVNHLQTRRGNQLVNYMSLENYWDYHFQKQEGFSHIGDFCTKFTMTPFKGLTLSTFFSIAANGEDDLFDDSENTRYGRHIIRNGRDVGNPGLDLKWLNRWSVSLRYEPVQDFIFNLTYNYQNRYRTQSVYSMGSTLTDIEAGSAFNKFYLTQTQQLMFGMSVPLTPDRRTFGSYQIFYDFNAGFVTQHRFALIRKFHCWEVAAELNIDTELDDGEKSTETSFYITAYLTGLLTPLQQVQSTMLAESRKRQENGGLF